MIASHRSNRGFSVAELLVVFAIGAILATVGTPVLRATLGQQRLQSGAQDLGNALSEARREAFRTSARASVEVDPAKRRLSVFVWSAGTSERVERRRLYLPRDLAFDGIASVTSYAFDTQGRPTALPLTVRIRSMTTGQVRVVSVLATGRVTIT